MNIMRKSLALIVGILLILSTIPALATTTAFTVADEITFSMISAEKQEAVTKALDLSLEEIKAEHPDAVINWRSSNPSVLTIAGDKAIVTKGTGDTSLNLTADVFLDGSTAQKTFALKVLKRNANVVRSEDFEKLTASEKDVCASTVSALTGNGFDSAAMNPDYFEIKAVDDPEDNTNSALKISRITGVETDASSLYLSTAAPSGSNRWIIKFKFKVEMESAKSDVRLYFRGYDPSQSKTVNCELAYCKNATTLSFWNGSVETSNAITADYTKWTTLTIDINIDTMLYDVYLTGVDASGNSVNEVKIGINYAGTKVAQYSSIESVRFLPHRGNTGTHFYLDDVFITAETGESLTDSILAARNGNEIAIRNKYDADNDTAYIIKNVIEDTLVNDNSLIVSKMGKMDSLEGNSFNLSSSIQGGALGTPSFDINGYTVGSGNGYRAAVKVTSNAHGLHIRDLGRIFTDDNGARWTLVGVEDENNLLFLSENTGASDYKWNFVQAVTGALTDGITTITVALQTPNQPLYPSTVRKSLTVKVIDEEGVAAALNDGELLQGEKVEIKEVYSILNPVDVALKLNQLRGANGYSEIPQIEAEEIAELTVAYTFDENGRVVLKSNHRVLIETSEFTSFSYNAIEVGNGFSSLSTISTPNRFCATDSTDTYEVVLLPVLDGFNNLKTPTSGKFTLVEQNGLPKNTLPAFIPPAAFPEGITDMTINAVSIWQYGSSLNSGIFEFDYEGETFLYFDFDKSLTYQYALKPNETRSVVIVSNSGDVVWSNESGAINVTADSSSDGLIIKIGSQNKTDEEYAREFLDQYGTTIGVDITDTDYTDARESILTYFVADLYAEAPASHADIKNALMRAQSIPSMSGLAVSEVDGKIRKYGKYVGISEETYNSDARKYGAVEIGTAFREKNFASTQEILDCYNNRIAMLNVPSGGGGSLGGESSSPKPKEPVYIEKDPEPTPVIPVIPQIKFSDLSKSHWSYEYMTKLAVMGVISGYEDGSVHPEESVTREQLVKMLVVALDLKAKDETVTFNDVSNGYWSEEFISIGAANGLITGYDDGSFKPQKKVTREEMAVIINRALSIAKITITGESEAPEFADSESFSSYAAESINAVSKMGIINGMGNNTFAPKDYLTRAQAAKVIYSVCAGKGGEA